MAVGIVNAVPVRVALKFLRDDALNRAVLIAWNGLFALFPIMLVMASLLGLLLRGHGTLAAQIYTDILSVVPDPKVQEETIKALESVKQQSGLLAIVGLLGLLWGGSALFGSMEEAFARIYDTGARGFVAQKVMSLGMILLFSALAGLALATSSLLPAMGNMPYAPHGLTHGAGALVLQVVAGALVGVVLYLAIYYVVPNRLQRWSSVWPGALLAGVLFEGLTLLFPLYIHVNRGVQAYGRAFSLMLLLLTFFFFLGIITMLGVELNSVLHPSEAAATQPQPETGAATVPGSEGDTPSERRRRSHLPRNLVLLAAAWLAGLLMGKRASGA